MPRQSGARASWCRVRSSQWPSACSANYPTTASSSNGKTLSVRAAMSCCAFLVPKGKMVIMGIVILRLKMVGVCGFCCVQDRKRRQISRRFPARHIAAMRICLDHAWQVSSQRTRNGVSLKEMVEAADNLGRRSGRGLNRCHRAVGGRDVALRLLPFGFSGCSSKIGSHGRTRRALNRERVTVEPV